MRPEWHIGHTQDECYQAGVKDAIENKKYIKASISKDDIGHLLQGKHITLLFLNDEYVSEGMLDIELTDDKTEFDVSEELNNLIISNSLKTKNGEWLLEDFNMIELYSCSVCGFSVYGDDYYKDLVRTKYCPHCGTRMNGEFEVIKNEV